MIKALISMDMDLASGIALRYAYQLANLVEMRLRTIHVEKPDARENVPSVGWVRKKWEHALLQKEQDEIAQFLNTAKLTSNSVWSSPILTMGNRQEEIADQLEKGLYDLYIEGVLATFNISDFYQMIDSYLYRNLTCPVIMVKNLVDIHSILMLIDDHVDIGRLVGHLVKVSAYSPIDFDLIHFKVQNSGDMVIDDDYVPLVLDAVKDQLADQKLVVKKCQMVQGTVPQVSKYIKEYGLVVSSVHRPAGSGTPLLELLGHVPCPVFLSWQ